VGKSRVLYEFRRMLAERGVGYLEGWCQSFGQSIPYLPLQDLVRGVAEIGPSDLPAAAAQHIETTLARLNMAPEADAPYILRMLGIEHRPFDADVTPEAIRARTFETLSQLLLAAAAAKPLVIGIEDLHWIDKSSEAFLAHFVAALAGAPILLLTTTRPGYSAP
jgi:predicted ATPase